MPSLEDLVSAFGLSEEKIPERWRRLIKIFLVLSLIGGGYLTSAWQWLWNWTTSLYRAGPAQFLSIVGILVVCGLLGWLLARLLPQSRQIESKTDSPKRLRAQYSRGGLLWLIWIEADKGPAAIEVQSYCPDPCNGVIHADVLKGVYCVTCAKEFCKFTEYIQFIDEVKTTAQGDWRVGRRNFSDDSKPRHPSNTSVPGVEIAGTPKSYKKYSPLTSCS